jgi:cytoskeletal protein RodZ
MSKDTFGESLKREREMRGVTLDEISAATRIATRFLRAIENEEWDQLPGGVFNRGFVRAVAHYLGLDEENIVAEYILAVGDRPSVPVWTGSPPVVTPDQPWLAWIIAALILVSLLAGGWFGTRRLLARRAAKRAAQAAALSAAPSPEPMDAPPPISSAEPAPPVNAAPAPNAAPNAPDATPGATTVATDSTPVAAPSAPATDRFELTIEANKKTKVTVVADKDVVFEGTMKSGEKQFFSAADHFQVSAKDAGALHLEMNGHALGPLGRPGHSAKVKLTRDALKGASGSGN